MSARTVNSVQPMVLPANISQARTYSVAPSPAYIPDEKSYPSAAQPSPPKLTRSSKPRIRWAVFAASCG